MRTLTPNGWLRVSRDTEDIDYERELVTFTDPFNSSVDMRVTFVPRVQDEHEDEPEFAYIVLIANNDTGEAHELLSPYERQINVSWEEAERIVGVKVERLFVN